MYQGPEQGFQEITWESSVVWSAIPEFNHHDIAPLPNGNVLVIVRDSFTNAEALAEGRDPATLNGELGPLTIIEITPSGTIVWEWHLWDHLIQDFDSAKANFGVVADHPELVDVNFIANLSANWIHMNSIDYNPELDQIVMSTPRLNELWVIDHSTTTAEAAGHTGGTHGKGGDLLYRWGNPDVYQRGVGAGDQRLFGQHDVHWIPA